MSISSVPLHTLSLVPHSTTPAPAGVSIAVGLWRKPDGGWRLDYRIRDPQRRIRWPAPQAPGAADGLWQHTCCEAFVSAPPDDAYLEFNASPSAQWACYRFARYRERADQGQPAWRPRIECAHDGADTIVSVPIDAALLPQAALHVGLTCVIETTEGGLSYWALTHPAATPDFHHRDGFALMPGKE